MDKGRFVIYYHIKICLKILRFKIRTTSLHLLLYCEGELDCSHGLNSILLVAFMWQIALAGEPKMASFTRWQPWWHSSKCQSRVALGSSSVVSLLCDLWVVKLTEQDQALRRNSTRDSHRSSTAYQTSESQIFTSRTSCDQTKIRAIPTRREINLCLSNSENPLPTLFIILSYFSI